MFEVEKGVHSTLQSMHHTRNFSGEDLMINVFAIIQYFNIILDDLNIYPIRIFTLIKLLQIKEEQGLPTVTITLHVADNFWPQKSFPLNSALFAHRELLYFKNTYRVIICNCHFLYHSDGH